MPVERWRGGLAVALMVLAGGAAAQLSERTLQLCAGCHGVGGNSPTPTVPSLAAQPKVFVENQLVLVREGLRDIPVMKDAVKDLSDEQIVALAIYYAAQPLKPQPRPVQPERMRAGADLSRKGLCGSCHLSGYTGQQQVPRLAGQHEAYLLLALKQFRDSPGPGRDTIMASTLRGLADSDLENLAHYMAHGKP